MNTLHQHQKGISLLSILVASAIGIFLTGAALKVYVDSKNTFNTRNVIAEVIENQRFAIDDMRRILVMAGRGIRFEEDQKDGYRSLPKIADGVVVDGASGSDTLAIRYRIGPSCTGYENIDMADPPTTVRFHVDGDVLMCNGEALSSGIHLLKALYGVDDDEDGFADRYLTASMVESDVSIPEGNSTPWARVVSIRIGLVGRSESTLPPSSRPDTPPTLYVLGMPYTPEDSEHLYRVSTATISLRNLNSIVERQ